MTNILRSEKNEYQIRYLFRSEKCQKIFIENMRSALKGLAAAQLRVKQLRLREKLAKQGFQQVESDLFEPKTKSMIQVKIFFEILKVSLVQKDKRF